MTVADDLDLGGRDGGFDDVKRELLRIGRDALAAFSAVDER